MKNKLIQELENKSIDELIALKNDYPFVALFHIVAAKKAKQQQHSQQENFVTSASLRVPSRQVLKDYLNVKTKYQPKTQLERVLFAPFLQEPDYTVQKVEEHQPIQNIKEPIDEQDDIEVELYNIEEPISRTENVLDDLAKQEEQIEEVTDDSIEVEFYEMPKEAQPSLTETISEPIDLTEDTIQQPFKNDYNEIIDDEIDIDFVENNTENTVFNAKQINQLKEQEVEPLPQEVSYQTELNQEVDLNDEHFIELPEEVEINEEEIRITSTYDEIAHDNNEEIGEHFILPEEEQIEQQKSNTTVDELTTETNSVYKQVVEILKQDQQTLPQPTTASSILLNEQNEVERDKEPQQETVEEFIHRQNEIETVELENDVDEYDDDLELLYQEAAYVREIENEIKEMQEQNLGAGQPENSDQKFSFMSWLSSFSEPTQPQTSSVKENNKQTVHQQNAVAKEIEYQYRDSDEDLNDETSRHVQEVAMKSMQKNKAFYTETLAVIYAMQEKYEQAIEVYEQLAINNSEKSSYFADQINKLKENLD